MRKQQRSLPTLDPHDSGYRRLRYVRYADDILLGFAGPKAEAEEIKRRLGQFLRDELKLELSETKTLITHARTDAARFLGYEVTTQHADYVITGGRRVANGQIALRAPTDVIKAKCAQYMRRGKPERRPGLLNDPDHEIISRYGSEYRGIVQYYLLAGDVWRLNRLHWVMLTSRLKLRRWPASTTRRCRRWPAGMGPRSRRRTGRADACRSPATVATDVSHWSQRSAVFCSGGRSTRSSSTANQSGMPPLTGSELIRRLLAGRCEICGRAGWVQVHQIRKLADLDDSGQPQPDWVRNMKKRRRTTLVVCGACHTDIHEDKPTASNTDKSLESPVS